MKETSKYLILKSRCMMETNNYKIGTKVIMKKAHSCGANEWEITRVGADIKIKCTNCGRTVLIPRIEFNKKLKKIISQEV